MEKLRDFQDAMPRHWSICFLVSPCYLQRTMPCQWWSSDRECYGSERAFFTLRRSLSYTPFCWFQGFPGSRQFNHKVGRTSCWSSKHSPALAICLNHNTPQQRYTGSVLSKVYGWPTTWRICSSRDSNSLHDKLCMLEVSCFIRLVTELYGLW